MRKFAPRLLNLGNHKFLVSTHNRQAQQFISQGMNLAYAFNHSEARRSFREAARLDSKLAMAYWGQALVLGPNINAIMDPNEEAQALEMVQQAKLHMAKASQRERALINALEKRYSGKSEHRKLNDKAYAEAMREVHKHFPDDPDITMLYVESMMNIRPWGYWMLDGYSHEGTEEIEYLEWMTLSKDLKKGSAHPQYKLLTFSSLQLPLPNFIIQPRISFPSKSCWNSPFTLDLLQPFSVWVLPCSFMIILIASWEEN